MKVLVIGKPSYDVIIPTDKFIIEGSKNLVKEKYELIGGASIYTAELLTKWGVDVTFTGVVGNDAGGQRVKADLEALNINVKYLEINYEHKTSLNYILVNKENGSSTSLKQVMDYNLVKYKYDFNPDFIISDGTDMPGTLAALNNYPNSKFILLANVVSQEYYNVSKRCNYVVANSAFAKALTKLDLEIGKNKAMVNFFQKIKDLNKADYVVTLKDKGVLYAKDRDVKMLPAVKTNVVDDTNAGPAFFAAYCYGIINGFDKDVVMKIANTTAAIAMQKYGVTGIPMLNDVLKVLNIKIEGVNDKEETESKPAQSDAQNANESATPKQEGEETKSE